VIEGTSVTRITRRADGRYALQTSGGDCVADQVLIATGGYDLPMIPPYAANLDPAIR
jgi:putative flavoprotein involved in K+ transport